MSEIFNNELYFTKEGNGNVVLFLHGWGCSGNIFSPISSRLKNHTIVTLDLWGFGKTPLPSEFIKSGLSIFDYADKVAEFIKKENLENITLVGHSFGGRVGIVLAAKYPDLVKKLVLVSSAGLKKFSLKKYFKIAYYKHLKKRASHNQKLNEKIRNLGSSDFKACNDDFKPTFLKIINESLESYAPLIRCNTLLIWGENDTETPLWMAKRYNKLIPNSGLVIMSNCGHFCFLEDANLFFSVLKSFLNSKEY